MTVLLIKQLHIIFALTSLAGFVLRGMWMMRGSSWLQRRWVKIAPHVVDAVLLTTGVVMVVQYQQYPTQQAWLAAKLLALVVYIILGSLALKRARTRQGRIAAWIGALLVFGYILSVAMTRQPWPML